MIYIEGAMGSPIFGITSLEKALSSAENMMRPKSMFFVRPDYFTVEDAINPHMIDHRGELNQVNQNLAHLQWQQLVETYRGLGFKVHIFNAQSGCPDMVFCANQSFPYTDQSGDLRMIMGKMENPVRQREVPIIKQQLQDLHIITEDLTDLGEEMIFEGMGDALWVPGRRYILGGYGFRTHPKIYEILHEKIQVPIVTFELSNAEFYHLDTCLSILNHETAMACREAFSEEGWQTLQLLFKNVIVVSYKEADSPYFACNAHCPDGKHVILQEGSRETERQLIDNGFVPLTVQTSEYIKSGGSVFCMKQILFA